MSHSKRRTSITKSEQLGLAINKAVGEIGLTAQEALPALVIHAAKCANVLGMSREDYTEASGLAFDQFVKTTD